MMLFRLLFMLPFVQVTALWCDIVGHEPVFNLIWMELVCVKGHVAAGDFLVN